MLVLDIAILLGTVVVPIFDEEVVRVFVRKVDQATVDKHRHMGQELQYLCILPNAYGYFREVSAFVVETIVDLPESEHRVESEAYEGTKWKH